MKYECEVIQDLLPLYKDSACSVASALAVQEHLNECEKCKKFLDQLNDTSVDELIIKEKENVIGTQSKYFKRKSAVAGSVVGGIFALPILISLIVNLVTGHGLTWFFLVLAGMLIPTSLFVVPLMAPKNRMFLTMTSLTGSILFLLAVCCIYSQGDWFFVAAPAVLFGLTVCFAPFIACRRPMNAYLKNRKGLAVMCAYTVTFLLMALGIGFYADILMEMLVTSAIMLVAAWAIFLIARYLPANGWVKTGVCIAAFSAFTYLGSEIGLWLTLRSMEENDVLVHSQPSFPMMLAGVGIGAAVAVIGLLFGKKGGKKQ
ncbi:MAG: zf-HC2 domain-containing protein [Lachnospiraceae bacterium]|nr:zf-HC2 domain-containing protein [Lachnospiraceae bacterium]